MGETRRHSVDVPITRTLVALRRVRSLRDPCTTSMSKFASLLDNVKWETGSNNGISLQFVEHGDDACKAAADAPVGLIPFGSYSIMEELESGCDLHKLSSKVLNVEGDACSRSSQRSCADLSVKGRELACNVPSISHVEEAASGGRYRTTHYSTKLASSVGEYGSRLGSPVTSTNHSYYGDEDVDFDSQSNRGCGITYCWSRTPGYRGSNQSSDVEEYPLLPGNGNGESDVVTPSHEVLSRSLSQKFGPKSFDELVGQEVVVKCLLSTILRGRITSVYLFHGPRGTGKTSTSKIFAAALNCLSQAAHSRPCGLCSECKSYFSGRGRDVMETDSGKLNRPSYLRSLIKNASLPPVSSRFKVFIIDECQLLCQETWGTLLNSLDNFSQHSVFILVTSELEKLPRNVLSRSQKYHFSKVCDVDISTKLAKICVEEGIDFDQGAVDFIASKSDGSLRDAEIMLDQLSLLGKRITTSLAYKLIGVVSDDELLDLLDLALSSDTSNTVIRARELMRSKIDPMQLISQLANVIMDIIAGNSQESSSATRLRFLTRHTSEEEMQKLRNALKILSDAEKHLRASKNQTTWLTVALLQLSNTDSSSFATDENGRNQISKDVELSSTSSDFPGDVIKSETEERQEKNCNETAETVWKTVTDLCCSDSLKRFLWKRGRLTSLTVDKGVAIAELEFYTPQHVARAEKSWKLIADSFQSVLGCNVEIRMNLVISACSPPKSAKAAASLFFGLFSCSRRMLHKSYLTTKTDSDCAFEKPAVTNSLRSCQGNVLRARSVRSSANASSRMSCSSDQGDANSAMCTPHMPPGEKRPEDDSDVLCWKRTPIGKGQGETQNSKSSRLIGRVLPCSTAAS
ncbi:P-loop containing nucleoside triphosphate hydrolase [Arabidopsis thaliana x Arabidopsis arenosa]|uniref:P-loop containing nucleoside triphosphate hydrolase n=1 Tax=Arabidopsis thaliana x Arabidopsis arenosa TaxID=1240361 RepID=A0A8T1Y4K8_9BRAS|nr:P-loop containing nucleoside triphosphate hydrolase [Arabidopsis thaliana x Arabidopsis arenosa]KAG7541594.1 P-loop containing nucleoside triphosphate hydrolase [Arabidopsis thaliana x Arabidopsis arenosa]KAG7541596.1 P-loop containing nucleoside triphosphate hydrolase [Arabidopsis thaliana x Arabidopsis arenosa]